LCEGRGRVRGGMVSSASKGKGKGKGKEEGETYTDVYREVFLIGTEWENYDRVYEDIPWRFPSLDRALSRGGFLDGKTVYMFGSTEPQMMTHGGHFKVFHLPVMVVLEVTMEPSHLLGIKSVQMESERLLDMRRLKVDWCPVFPDGVVADEAGARKARPRVFGMKCTQRRSATGSLMAMAAKLEDRDPSEVRAEEEALEKAGKKRRRDAGQDKALAAKDRLKEFEYCLPYVLVPGKQEEELEDTVAPVMFDVAGFKGKAKQPPIVAEFDYAMDDLNDYCDEMAEAEDLGPDAVAALKEHIKASVRECKRKFREAKAHAQALVDAIPPEKADALKAMKVYKFYPDATGDVPDVEALQLRSRFVNRYYGHAHKLLP